MPASESSYEFGVICEARADQLTACGLADRVLLESIDWLAPELLDSSRRWRGESPEEFFLEWRKVKERFDQSGIKGIFGFFGGKPGQPDALIARKALLLFSRLESPPAAVLLIRDSDGYDDRKSGQGLEQARETYTWPFSVIIGVAHPKREAWVLSGFQPRDAEESRRLQELRDRLSMDPIQKSHELDAREHGAKTDIKRALAELTQGDRDREGQCLKETGLDVLEQRGEFNGLATYLNEVRERLVPIFSGHKPEQ